MYKALIIRVLIILFLIPVGFFSKKYTGGGATFINTQLGGFIYVVWWIFLFSILFPKHSILKISGIVFLITSILEFTQLMGNDLLITIRKYYIGRLLIGTTFNPIDFIWYFFGAIFAFVMLKRINKLAVQ